MKPWTERRTKRFTTALVAGLLLLTAACATEPDDDEGPGPWPDQAPGERWQPRPGTAWQWQLTGRLDPSVDVPVYDIDGFNTTKEEVARLKKDGRKTICYISAGAYEDFRPDAGKFPKALLGEGNGWEGERWLDIRATAELEPIMAQRFDMCRDKGFDAVEPDNMDAYRNRSGFPVTADDQLKFNRLIARLAHDRGLAVGLKNDLDQIPELVGDFDFAVNEQCAQYRECERLTPFIEAGKAVFHAEYELPTRRFCKESRALKLSSLEKKLELGAWRKAC
ncbi:endo alpha-1,4 polygalactosaminidase [Streptomyces sp. RerS4]|uniref:endo alpha-1,4 polygalactosaminidase n=1 Tax=Streptomyces sp. RerS4 TaxID=2942449 RepID=UPI00201C74BB|nr:endo alpha-1,4 polygalactosaminidase [Streptomyces sp. RerS4]UQX00835.1 endo alpha-1,4 polygalactosaminidase [Streptomyces sp. RerS4]